MNKVNCGSEYVNNWCVLYIKEVLVLAPLVLIKT